MNRREFLAALAVAASLPANATPAETTSPDPTRAQGPYGAAFRRIPEDADDFGCETSARLIEKALHQLPTTRTLPLTPDFQGISPLPKSYTSVADRVRQAVYDPTDTRFAQGLETYIANLGPIRRANFFALPGNLVRYEIATAHQFRVGLWKQIWTADGKLREFAPVEETLTESAEPLFQDITGHAFAHTPSFQDQLAKGNTYWRSHLDAATGIDLYANNGIAVGDIDNDGIDEIYVCQPSGLPNRLYKIRPGATFEDITNHAGLGILDDTTCALFLDLRNSGNQDLVVLRAAGPLLFFNDGKGKFTEHPNAFRFRNPPQGSFTGMAAADYNRDGRLDLYLCCYVYFQSEDQYRYPVPYHDARNGPPNFLFRNALSPDGGYFEDVTDAVGLNQNNDRYSFAPAWCDFDHSGWPSLYVANDFGRNNLYRNRQGKFEDEAEKLGVDDIGPGMSATWLDYTGEGHPGLYVSNMWSAPGQRIVHDPAFAPSKTLPEPYRRHTKGNSLYRNRGDGTFEETGAAEGVEMGRWAWSSDAFDFDNDGTPEIYVTNGMLANPKSRQDLRSFFWRQVVAKSPTTAQPAPDYENGWNAINQLIREDYSWCGDDANVFYVRPQPAPGHKPRFYDFSGVSGLDFSDDSRSFVALDLDGDGNLDLILKSRQAPQIRVLRNNCGQNRPVLVLRLQGTKSNRDAIGARVEAGKRTQIVKAGSGYLSQHTKQLHFALGTRTESPVTITWPSGETQQLPLLKAGFRHTIVEGSPQVVSEPLQPSRPIAPTPLPEMKNEPGNADVWLLEPVPLPDRHPGPALLRIDTDPNGHYAVFRRYLLEYRANLELPLLLLIDAESRARKLYATPPTPAQLAADLASPGQPLPFPGRFYQQPHRNYFKLGAAFYWAGFPNQAIPYLEEVMRRNPENWKALNAIARIQLDAGQPKSALVRFTQVLALKPAYPPALAGLGEAHAALDNLPAAEALFRQALDINPNDSDAANQLGVLYARQNRLPDARRYFQQAIAAHKDHAGAINNLAVLYGKLGQTNDAIAAFQFGIEQSPNDPTLYMNLGRLYAQSGEFEKARQVMHRLLQRIPNDPSATKALQELESR